MTAAKFDDVIKHLGEFGTYQKRIYFLLCLPSLTGGMQVMLFVFTLATPNFRCAIPGLDNDTFAVQSSYHEYLVNLTSPHHDSCHVINLTSPASGDLTRTAEELSAARMVADYQPFDGNNVSLTFQNAESADVVVTCSRFVYDKSVYSRTIVTDMNLVCSSPLSPSLIQMIYMSGALFSTVVCSPLSDIFGRKKLLMASLVLHAVSSLGIAWFTHLPFLCILLFGNGVSITTGWANAFVIGMEFVGPKKRVWAGYVMEIFWSLGMMLLAPLAFWLRDWQQLQIAGSILPLAFLSYFWLIPESSRWLLSRGRRQEAEAILQAAARLNKVSLPPGLVDSLELSPDTAQQSLLSVFRHPVLLGRSAILFFNWFVSSMAFYGLGLGVGRLAGSVHVNLLLSGLMELLAFLLCILLLDRVGRRLLNTSLMLLAGVSCVATILPILYAPPSLWWTSTALAMIGKFGISGGFGTIWVFSSELFPTVIRNGAMGACSFCARIGSVICPYIAGISTVIGGDIGTAAPLLIFGSCAIVAGLLLLTLPETLHRNLPDSVQDALSLKSKGRLKASETTPSSNIKGDDPECTRSLCEDLV